MRIITSIAIGIISGIVSSVIASILISNYYKRKIPQIEISNEIAKNESNEYRIKIVNKSKFYLTNVLVEARLITIKNGVGGTIINKRNLDIPTRRITMIEPFSSNNTQNSYAIWVGISKELERLWKDDSCTHLKVSVYCSNEWNVSKVYEQCYYKKHICIRQGEFACGDNMNVV